jgi:hypothetical protein
VHWKETSTFCLKVSTKEKNHAESVKSKAGPRLMGPCSMDLQGIHSVPFLQKRESIQPLDFGRCVNWGSIGQRSFQVSRHALAMAFVFSSNNQPECELQGYIFSGLYRFPPPDRAEMR